MDDLMKWLFAFLNEKRLGAIRKEPEYKELAYRVNLQTKKVEAGMTRQQKDDLELLLEDITAQYAFENRYLFQTTLELAHELHSLL